MLPTPDAAASDRSLPLWLRLPLLAMAISQAMFGLTLFLNPGAIADLWPWPLTEATARLLAASTLVSVPLAVLSVAANRFSAARIPLVMMLTYRVLQIGAGLLHLGKFDFTQPATWNYFGSGSLMMVVLAAGLFRGPRSGRPAEGVPAWLRGDARLRIGRAGASMLKILGTAYIALAVAYFALGADAGSLWFEAPGKLTPLTARLFSSPTCGLGLAMWLVARAKLWREVGIPALGMATFGISGAAAMALALPDLAPATALGYVVPVTPLVLLGCGVYLLSPRRSGAE